MLLPGILGHTTAQAQLGGVPLWTNRYDGPGNANDDATAIAVDSSGNVFVTGSSYDTNGYSDYATIKYSAEGVPLWTNRYNGPGNLYDSPSAVALDGSGNVLVTGYSFGTNGISDYATVKYSGAGVALWTNRYNGPGNKDDRANAVAVDGSGDVFVTGYSFGGNNGDDYATIAYSGAGVALWTNRYNGPGNGSDQATAVAVDGSGNVFVTGYSVASNSVVNDYTTIAYSGAGAALWTNRYNGPGNNDDRANAMAVDGSGNVFVTGYSHGGSSYNDYATIKYSGGGVALWTNRYNGPGNYDDQATAVAVDGSGNVFVTGYSFGTNSNRAFTTIKYSGTGVALWTNRFDGNSDPRPNAVAVDGSGNVFVTGYSYSSGSLRDYATLAYSGAGVALWTNRYNGPGNGNDYAQAMAVDRNGNVFVTGYSVGVISDYATIKYSAIPSLSVARTTENTVVVSWPSPSTGFTLQSTTNLVSPAVWNTNLPSPVVINGQNTVTNPISGTQQFFRLSQ
ncbi:MAG: SBBP repeat-containing protein [Verrucomicrobiota bacterium]